MNNKNNGESIYEVHANVDDDSEVRANECELTRYSTNLDIAYYSVWYEGQAYTVEIESDTYDDSYSYIVLDEDGLQVTGDLESDIVYEFDIKGIAQEHHFDRLDAVEMNDYEMECEMDEAWELDRLFD